MPSTHIIHVHIHGHIHGEKVQKVDILLRDFAPLVFVLYGTMLAV
jgi:hypothetical protein